MITHNVKMKATEQERQMVEVVRDHRVDASSDFRLLVQRQDGAWDVTLSIAPHDELNTSRGTGATFNDAWDNMEPSEFLLINPVPSSLHTKGRPNPCQR